MAKKDEPRPDPHAGYSGALRRLMQCFGDIPGVGARSAERMAFHVLTSSREKALGLADAIRAVKEQVRHCSICYNLTESDPCPICANPQRDPGVVCVVEQPRDLMQLEATGVYTGVYHVLLGRLAPLEHVSPADLTTPHLLERIRKGQLGEGPLIREIVLATNPTMEGDTTALHLQQEIAKLGGPDLRITRLARGLPAGAQIEYSNKAILADAIAGRTQV